MPARANWIDRTVGYLSPRRQVDRMRARMALEVMASHYDAAQSSRRTLGWKRPGGDPNAPSSLSLSRLRDSARHLVRNNGHAQSALRTIVDDTVGWGIMPTEAHAAFEAWATSTDIDADGRCDLPGLEQMVMRTVAEAGECLVRRRWRRLSDGLALPIQLQVLEPDFIDTSKHRSLSGDGRIVRGVEFDKRGQRVAYWLYREHPGSTTVSGTIRFGESVRVPASEIAHVFRNERPGQVRAASWFAPVLLRSNDFDEFADATLMKQKIAACLTVLTSDVDGSAAPIGTEKSDDAEIDQVEPGLIANLDPGRTVTVVDPPSVRDYPDYVKTTLQEISAGIGVTYEAMTGDYTKLPFSAARMSRLHHWARVEGWRWQMLVPQFLTPTWRWAMQAAAVAGIETIPSTFWTAPPLPMIEPDKEGLAILRNIRTGITTLPEELRRRGYNVKKFLDEYQESLADLDRRGIVLDSDVRKMTQAGQRHKDGDLPSDKLRAEVRNLLGKLPPDLAKSFLRDLADGNGAGADR